MEIIIVNTKVTTPNTMDDTVKICGMHSIPDVIILNLLSTVTKAPKTMLNNKYAMIYILLIIFFFKGFTPYSKAS